MSPTNNNKTNKKEEEEAETNKTHRKICAFRDIALFSYLFTRSIVLRSQKQSN